MIFELSNDIDKEFQLVKAKDMINSGAVKEVFFVSDRADVDVLRTSIKVGAREFFSRPIADEDIVAALKALKERKMSGLNMDALKTGKIINIIGSKGGVGVTTVAVNLAVSLAEKKGIQSVALIDMNLLFGDIPLFLNIEPKYNWGDITKNITRLDATFLNSILSTDTSGVCVIPSPSYLSQQKLANPGVIERLLNVMRKRFDYIVIDGGQSLDNISLKILEMTDTALLVTVLNLSCLANTHKLLKSFGDLGFPSEKNIKVIANRYLQKSDISKRDAEASIEKEIFWTIPNDYTSTVTALNRGKALVQFAPKKEITKNFRKLAAELSSVPENRRKF
jgi:pilus assembly protein CpaE